MLRWSKLVFPLLAAGIAVIASASGSAAAPTVLTRAFDRAAFTYRVPRPILLAEGYVNTRLEMPGHPALDGGVGIMHLSPSQVRKGARLIGASRKAVRHDAAANIRAGAALLASMRPRSSGLAAWFGPLARLGGSLYADEVFETLRLGFQATVGGERLGVPPEPVKLPRRSPASSSRSDYPNGLWRAASRANYTSANRPLSHPITTIVIHVTQGSYAGTINWFANSRAHASAHYVVRSLDGQVTQVVHEKDIAWHAGNWAYNLKSVGIEHEGFESNCRWYTDAMYRGSAQLAAYLAAKYLIPIDRKHIIGHSEVPDPNNPNLGGGADHHTDPGPCWNWTKYMALVRSYAQTKFATALQRIGDDARSATFKAPRGWVRRSSPRSYAGGYALARAGRAAPARYTLSVPKPGSYALYSWWPALSSRSGSVPVGIDTTSGRKWVAVDERTGSGWRYLGTFDLAGKAHVLVSPRTAASGSVAADAFKVELLSSRFENKLVSGEQGWVLSTSGLSRTSNGGGGWQTVSPPGVSLQAIRGADWSGATAYTAVATGSRTSPLKLEWTADRGATWSSSSLPVPPSADVAGPVDVQAPDPQHLFVGLRLEPSGRALSRGLLLRSSNGGATWEKSLLPEGGEVSFATAQDGWLVGGFAREALFATHDGGKTWASVRPGAGVRSAYGAAYDPPVFSSATDGVIPVSLPAGRRSSLAFATTLDGGSTWKQAAVLRVTKPLGLGETVPSAIADPTTWLAVVGGKLVEVTGGGAQQSTIGPLPPGVTNLQFSSAQTGWARTGACRPGACSGSLYRTQDGGLTWNRIVLP